MKPQASSTAPSITAPSLIQPYYPTLDGVRAIAFFMVFVWHYCRMVFSSVVFRWGWTGGDLFFVLSGFLITGILFDSLHDEHFFRKFYARRALRIFPLYYGVLLILLLITRWLGIVWHGVLWSLAFYLQNTTLLGEPIYLFNPRWITVSHFWSLAVEEQFYLVWPLVVFLIQGRRGLLWTCAGVSCASILLRFALFLQHVPYQQINTNTLCRSDSLLLGGGLALLLRGNAHDAVLRAGRWIFAVGALSLVLEPHVLSRLPDAAALPITWSAFFAFHYTLLALASAGLLLWGLTPSIMQRVFLLRPLRFFGKYSYGLYILHLVALPALLPALRSLLRHVMENKGLLVALSGLLALGLSVVAAYASYHLYEKRFLRLKRLFDYTASSVAARDSSAAV